MAAKLGGGSTSKIRHTEAHHSAKAGVASQKRKNFFLKSRLKASKLTKKKKKKGRSRQPEVVQYGRHCGSEV